MSDASTERTRVTEPRSDGPPAWEVFVRSDTGDALSHAGSVRAPTREVAADQATALFPDAHTIWACPAEDVVRLTDRSLTGVDDGADAGTDAAATQSADTTGRAPADPDADGTGEPATTATGGPDGVSGGEET